jgi:hypothetical protein
MKKIERAVFDCYRELYRESTPSADFDKLMEEAPINERGQKVIDYMAYSLNKERYDEIVEKYCKKIPPRYRNSFRFEMYLGCGPKSE